jgi:hypothetical protein
VATPTLYVGSHVENKSPNASLIAVSSVMCFPNGAGAKLHEDTESHLLLIRKQNLNTFGICSSNELGVQRRLTDTGLKGLCEGKMLSTTRAATGPHLSASTSFQAGNHEAVLLAPF